MCAQFYVCPVCFGAQKPQLVRVSPPPAAQFGNHVVDVRLRRETAEAECSNREQLWTSWSGPPVLWRMTMSGAHLGSSVTEWADSVGIKIDLVPKLAHHRLARPERNPVVRRYQLWVFERARSGARPAHAL